MSISHDRTAVRRDEASRLLVELADRGSRGEYVPAFAPLSIYAGLRDVPAIRRTLATAITEVTPPLTVNASCLHILEEYRGDPEIDRLLVQLYGR